MDLELTNCTSVVVGGASGIGFAIGQAFADEGSKVVLIDRNPAVQESAQKLNAKVESLGLIADVTDFDSLAAAASTIKSRFGTYSNVVFAAGIGSGKFGFPFWNLQPQDWDRVIRVNLNGAANTAHAFCPELLAHRKGCIIFISSVAGQIGSQTDPPYSAAKAGIINFSICAAKDLAPYGVRANSICPGMVKTELNRNVWQGWCNQQPPERRVSYEEWGAEKIRNVVPLNRWQEPKDIADMVVFLCSDRARNVTGQTINVDGGFVMHW